MDNKLLCIVVMCLLTVGCGRKADIGVTECDDYLAKYEKCVAKRVPSENKKAFEENLARTRGAWTAMAQNAGARPGLGQACSLALDTARSTMAEYRCDW